MTAPATHSSSNDRPAGTMPSMGDEMFALAEELFPLQRSITGNGVRRTLRRLADSIPLTITETPTGTSVSDWSIPPEWNIRDGYVKDSSGNRLVDFQQSNLHIAGYSRPLPRCKMTFRELEPHLISLPARPHAIPFRSFHFRDEWAFCVSHETLTMLKTNGANTEYEVCIDANLEPGSLTYGEVRLPGSTTEEILIWTHICHPSLANDNLSGIVIAAKLAEQLQQQKTRYTYRIVFAPATIGAIAWLSNEQASLANIRAGVVLACLGDAGPLTYKRCRDGSASINHLVERVLGDRGVALGVRDFDPFGYDERQFNSPGYALPVGRLTRTPNGEYPEYHTSDDNLDLIRPEYLADSLSQLSAIIDGLEADQTYVNQRPFGEPRLGHHGLYDGFAHADPAAFQQAVLWTLNLSDGSRSLCDIAERAKLPMALVQQAAERLVACDLLAPTNRSGSGHLGHK